MKVLTPFKRNVRVTITQGDETAGRHSDLRGMTAYDFTTQGDKSIVGVSDGQVLFAGLNGSETSGYGYTVAVRHAHGVDIYAHLEKGSLRVNTGQHIRAGQVLGSMGSTGRSTGPHLHFERRTGSVTVANHRTSNTWSISGGTSVKVGFIDDPSPASALRLESWNSSTPGSILFNPVADISNVNGIKGQDEIIFRPINGDVNAFLSNTSGVAFDYHKIGTTGTDQRLIGSGNIAGSSTSNDELVFRSPQHEIYGFKINSNGVASQWYRIGGVGSDQEVVGIGDITGNGRDEIVFRSGENIGAFHMNNDGVARFFRHLGRAGQDRHVVGVGDITGNGRDEIIYGGSDGNITAMRIGVDGVATQYYHVGSADPSMDIIGPADINGDNREEIIFRATNGRIGAFSMNSSGVATRYHEVGSVDPSHSLIGFGNINILSPGEEILFRSRGGDLNALFMNRNGIATSWNRVGWADPQVQTM